MVIYEKSITFAADMKTTDEILKQILLPDCDDWSIDEVTCDDSSEEIHIRLSYVKSDIVVEGVHYPIYDHRPERDWRHLDMWQYKTIISARVPRYQKDGKTISVEVPWAMQDARMSWLLEKKR